MQPGKREEEEEIEQGEESEEEASDEEASEEEDSEEEEEGDEDSSEEEVQHVTPINISGLDSKYRRKVDEVDGASAFRVDLNHQILYLIVGHWFAHFFQRLAQFFAVDRA